MSSKLGIRFGNEVLLLHGEAVDVGQKLEAFRLGASICPLERLGDHPFGSDLVPCNLPCTAKLAGEWPRFCIGSETWEQEAELAKGVRLTCSLSMDSVLLIYARCSPVLIIRHNDDLPLDLILTDSKSVIAGVFDECEEWTFV